MVNKWCGTDLKEFSQKFPFPCRTKIVVWKKCSPPVSVRKWIIGKLLTNRSFWLRIKKYTRVGIYILFVCVYFPKNRLLESNYVQLPTLVMDTLNVTQSNNTNTNTTGRSHRHLHHQKRKDSSVRSSRSPSGNRNTVDQSN